MKKFILVILLAALLVSCDAFLDFFNNPDGGTSDDDIPLEPDQFYAVNFTNDRFYKVRTEMLYEGKKCVIWAENGSGVTTKKAHEIAAKYDDVIRPEIVNAFSLKNFTYNRYNFDDILDFANALAGKNKKNLQSCCWSLKIALMPRQIQPMSPGISSAAIFIQKTMCQPPTPVT